MLTLPRPLLTFPRSLFTISESAHDVDTCAGCRARSEGAVIIARITGSVGATDTDGEHSARVSRVAATIG